VLLHIAAVGTAAPRDQESVEKLHQFIVRRGGPTDFVAPPSQIAADMLSRRASSLGPPRSQTEQPQFFDRLLESFHAVVAVSDVFEERELFAVLVDFVECDIGVNQRLAVSAVGQDAAAGMNDDAAAVIS